MKRWLALVLSLGVALAALYLLVRGGASGPPLGHIDAESKARLEQVLERAEREEAEP